MFEEQPDTIREKIKRLATESENQENPSEWFETKHCMLKPIAVLVKFRGQKILLILIYKIG